MKKIFIYTENVKNFVAATKEAEDVVKDPVLLVFTGTAGFGKTDIAEYFTAQNGWVYVRALSNYTDQWMMQDLCFELNIQPTPKRMKPAFEAARDELRRNPTIVVIDEADKLSDRQLEWVRDLADLTFVPFILIGEKLLKHKLKRHDRLWRRALICIDLKPITSVEILYFAKQAADLTLTAQQAELLREKLSGNFGFVKRTLHHLEKVFLANKSDKVTDEMVKAAIKKAEDEKNERSIRI
jgi:DNA transposition AAA+ family ATPase